MAKVLFTVKVEAEKPRNIGVIVMQTQKLGQRIMKDRRLKRKTKNSWKKEID